MDLKRYIETLPIRYQNLAKRIYDAKRPSRSACIKLKCVDCMGYEDVARRVRDCQTVICPLHAVRPYQGKAKLKA
jgi:hypothetical protein